jgi:hypothetical protein
VKPGDLTISRREKYLNERLGRHRGLYNRLDDALCAIVQNAEQPSGAFRDGFGYYFSIEERLKLDLLSVGRLMTIEKDLVTAAERELAEALVISEEFRDKVKAVMDETLPLLDEQTKRIRATRMAVVSELHQALGAMKDVRKFFMERDYEEEMKRMERFVSLCEHLQKLKREGVLDAVCETSLRLMVQEEQSS